MGLSHQDAADLARQMTLVPGVIDQLLQHPDWIVRRLVARRLDLSAEQDLALARDASALVRRELAGRRGPLAEAAVRILAEDCNADVRYAIAKRPEVPDDVQEMLLEDSDPIVAKTAKVHQPVGWLSPPAPGPG